MGARLHRLEVDPVAGPVVTQIFRWRAAGRSAAAICRDLDADAIPCPSAHDPGRNRHRTGANWTAGAVLAILHNPRYLGFQVWARARKTDVLVDPANVQLGTRPVFIDNPHSDSLAVPLAQLDVWVVALAPIVGFIGNEWVARYRITTGRRIGSAALVADGLHARTDGFTSLAVLFGCAGSGTRCGLRRTSSSTRI